MASRQGGEDHGYAIAKLLCRNTQQCKQTNKSLFESHADNLQLPKSCVKSTIVNKEVLDRVFMTRPKLYLMVKVQFLLLKERSSPKSHNLIDLV